MKLYNTLTRSVETLKPVKGKKVSMYTCGPTVYDYAHIGHWFTYIRWDMVMRTLIANGYKPTWVMNITDVGHLVSDADEGEDKLEKGAKREGKTAWEVAKFYTEDFLACMRALNMLPPDYMPRATEHIPEQIELIQKLEKKGYTYTTSDGVYYDTSKFEGYAAFARLDLDDQQEGARVAINPEKRNPTDFALWKFSPAGVKRDMEWDSPWGKGFPGWHIECSAMSMKYLGKTIDIHTGGIDHIPVHHTNEIAQSEAVTRKRFANLWMHANHVMVNGEKISKSLGNGIRLQEIVEHGFSPMTVRIHVLESHYRSQSKFSWEGLEAAKVRKKNYERMADLLFQPREVGPWLKQNLTLTTIKQALADDLNTPLALSALSGLATQAEDRLISTKEVEVFRAMLHELDSLFGLKLTHRHDIDDSQKALIMQREQARNNQDWAKADELRHELTKQGLGVRDTPQGPVWHRI